MALAMIQDLEAIGALRPGSQAGQESHTRGLRLLDLASALVLQYARTDEATVNGWPDVAKLSVAAVVAEVAGRRLTSPAAPTVDQLGEAPAHMGLRLWPTDEAALDRIPEVVTARATATSDLSTTAVRSNSWHEVTGFGDEVIV